MREIRERKEIQEGVDRNVREVRERKGIQERECEEREVIDDVSR